MKHDALHAEIARRAADWQARIEALPGRHRALEALWDGDSDGWFLDVTLVTDGVDGAYADHAVDSLRYGSDGRLFAGTVPPWPEAVVARAAGERVAQELGLAFHFPAPDAPDDDCVRWSERDRAVACRACGKPLRPDRGAHARVDVCSPCDLEATRQRDLIADAPGHRDNRAVYCVHETGVVARSLFLNLEHDAAGLLQPLAAALREQQPRVRLSERTDAVLAVAGVVALRDRIARRIDSGLLAYAPRADVPEAFARPRAFGWRGRERVVQTAFNVAGETIDGLLGAHAFFAACAGAGASVRVVGNGGVTERDVAFLCLLSAWNDARPVAALRAAFPFLAAEAVDATLAKLARTGFLARQGDVVRLLTPGRVVRVAGP